MKQFWLDRGYLLGIVCTIAAIGVPARPSLGAGNDKFGRTYYIDGAGNWGFGVAEVTQGLTGKGYKGHIINFTWSPTLNPALDQTLGRPVARSRGADLGKEITRYLAKYPSNEVNIICLSAGTGVGVWACENVKSPPRCTTWLCWALAFRPTTTWPRP